MFLATKPVSKGDKWRLEWVPLFEASGKGERGSHSLGNCLQCSEQEGDFRYSGNMLISMEDLEQKKTALSQRRSGGGHREEIKVLLDQLNSALEDVATPQGVWSLRDQIIPEKEPISSEPGFRWIMH
eukprot:GHVP01035662.1.p1 GENE.GHVP01035662.1~~GHVP01035662.1.p1  ORF type:complete len:127 (-),score=23.61 GHVP01035662.1:453-833(-)